MKKLIIAIFFGLGIYSTLAQVNETRISQNTSKNYVEPYVAVNPVNGDILAAYFSFDYSNRDLEYVVVRNGNVYATGIINNAVDPSVAFDGSGSAYICYLSRSVTDPSIYVVKSSPGTYSFTNPVVAIQGVQGNNADKPFIFIDTNPSSPFYNRIYVTATKFPGNYSQIRFSYSTNNGSSFQELTYPISSTTPLGQGQFGAFPIVDNNNNVLVFWYREVPIPNTQQSSRYVKFFYNKSTDGGINFIGEQQILGEFERPGIKDNDGYFNIKVVPGYTPFGIRISPFPFISIDRNNGTIYLIANVREDIYPQDFINSNNLILIKSTNNGTTWLLKNISFTLDVFMPYISCDNEGRIFITFYDSNVEPYDNKTASMRLMVSEDGGNTFKQLNYGGTFDPAYNQGGFIGDYICTQIHNENLYSVYNKPLDGTTGNKMQVYPAEIPIKVQTTLQNFKLVGTSPINLEQSYLTINGSTQYLSPSYPFLNLFSRVDIEPSEIFYNPYKFYQWYDLGTRIALLDNVEINYENNVFRTLFAETKPLTVRNALEGTLDGGTIMFGEKNFDVTSRTSPYTENAFIYNPPHVQSTYRAEALTLPNLYNTSWNFVSWEDGTTNPVREEGITQNSSPEWRAIYKGIQKSNQTNAYANNSQRKFVRTDDGWLHNVYSSMGRVWYEAKSPTGNWEIMNGGNPIDDGLDKQAKLPSIDYAFFSIPNFADYCQIFIVYQEKFGSNSKVKIKYFHSIEYSGYEYKYQEEIATISGNYSETNTTPVVGAYNSNFTVVWKNGTTNLWARNGMVNLNPPNDGIQLQNSNSLNGTTSSSVNPSIYSSEICCTWIKKLAWEELSGGSSSIKFATIIGSQISGIIYTPSLDNGYTRNYNPSVVSFGDDAALCWIAYRKYAVPDDPGGGSGGNNGPGDPQPLGETKVFFRRFTDGSWTQPASYGNNINSVSINRNSDNSFAFAWSEGSTSLNKFVRSDNPALVYNTNTTGAHIQVGNFNSLNTMRLNSFKNTDLPYYFTVSEPFTIDQHESIVEREGVIVQDTTAFYFALGEISVDGQKVDFIIVPDTLNIENKETLNTYLLTEPFLLTNSSSFIYSVKYGITDSLAALLALSNGGSVRFSVELIDEQTGEILGTFDDLTYTSENIIPYENIAYHVNTEGIGSRTCRLRLVTEDNLVFNYSLVKSYDNEGTLFKKGLVQRRLELNDVVTSYDLAQNHPNPFNPSTTIRYQLPKDGMVTLKVYDILGAEVATLVNEEMVAGKHEVNFNASSLASGVYIYRLNVNDYVSVKKMLLIK